MRIFKSRVNVDTRGQGWSALIKTPCPLCGGIISFYSTLNFNECKLCLKKLPFPIRMAKDQQKRVEYHVHVEAEGDSGTDVH